MPLPKDPERHAAWIAAAQARIQAKRWKAKHCARCRAEFLAGDPKRTKCDTCRGTCAECGTRVGAQSDYCKRCSPAAQAQRAALHETMYGDDNPAKRPEVRARISAGVAANHPSQTYPELWAEHAKQMRRGVKPSPSRLEDAVAVLLPDLAQQYRVAGHHVDFADPAARLVVQVHGCWWHSCQQCYPGSPSWTRQHSVVRADTKMRADIADAKWLLIEVWQHTVRDDPAGVIAHVRDQQRLRLRGFPPP